VSKGIRYDALLVRELAEVLSVRLGGRRIRALRFSSEQRAIAFAFRDETFVWDLHPDRGWLTLEPRRDRSPGVALPADARIGTVTSPPDERLVDIAIEGEDAPGAHVRRIVIELYGTHRNALALDGDGIVRAVLRPRPNAERVLAVAKPYTPLPAAPRAGAVQRPSIEEWRAAFGGVAADDRRGILLARFAWTSPINAAFVLRDDDLDAAYERYHALVDTTGQAWVLRPASSVQPYTSRLDDSDARKETDLIGAFAAAAALRIGAATHETFVAELSAALVAVRDRLDRAAVRTARLRDQMRGAPEEATSLRRQADLLLAQLHRIPKGAAEAEVDDFAGGTLVVPLDPGLTPSANAARLYDAARKRERAAARIPKLLHAAEAERARLSALEARLAAGEATREEVARLSSTERRRQHDGDASLPYRLYRTTTGLEVRVGRGSGANDDLTFHHSAPDDIWLHAESVPGAHVILRWGKRDVNPPATDLHEAAVLAAVHSKARTSGTVPVVWTRRKYVRKPRKAGPGRVTMDRAKTVFVEPRSEVEKRLRVQDGD